MTKEKQSIQQAEKEYEEMQSQLKDKMKKKMEKFFEDNKESLKKDKEEKAAINKFMTKKSVTEVFTKYDYQLRYFFDFYGKSYYHELSRELEKEYENLNYKEFIKFGYESHIIPTLIPINEIIYIFNQLTRERNEADPKSVQTIDYESFKKALVRISAVAQGLLGGQKGPLLEKKMEEETKKTEKQANLKEKVAAKNAPPAKTTKKVEEDLDRAEESDEEKKKAAKAAKKEGSLFERGAKPARQKVIKPNPKEETLKNSTLLKGKLDEGSLLTKKSHNINKLYEIESKAKAIENLHKVKVEDTRITTECDVTLITDKTIEALLKFIGLDPADDRFVMDKKLNAKRIEIQGTKPNKFSKKDVPDKADVISNADDTEEEQEEAEGEGKDEKEKTGKKTNDKNKTNDKKKTAKEDEEEDE